MVKHQEVFSESIQKNFAYLANDFGFGLVENQYHQSSATCIVAFQNQVRYVRFAWALRGSRLDFRICRVLGDGMPVPYKDYGTDEFLLFALVKYFEPQIDLDALTAMNYYNPDLQILDEKISAYAKVLWKYGQEILKGNEWFDWVKEEIIPNPK